MNLLSRIRNSRASAASGAPAAAEAAAEATAGLQPLALPPYVQPRVGAAGPRVVVIGAGRMGQLIAGQLALRGSVAVILYDLSTFTRERALAAVRASLDELEGNGLLPRGAAEEAMTRITVSETLADILQANLVVEAVPEDLAIKRNIFLEVDKVLTREKVPTGAGPLLCSNSISLAPDSIFKIKHKLWCNMRFLSPVFFIDEVELIAEGANAQLANDLLAELGMVSIPKMVGDQILRQERVTRYYDRQREQAKTKSRLNKGGSTNRKKDPKELPDCAVCLSRSSGALILPCGHTSTCHDCALQLCSLRNRGEHRCPICRGYIEKVLQADCPTKAEISGDGKPSAWGVGGTFS